MGTIASQITSLTFVYSALYSGADQSKHQRSASLAFVWRIHRGPVNSPHKWPVTRKMSPFDDVIMSWFGDLALWGLIHNHFRIFQPCPISMVFPCCPNPCLSQRDMNIPISKLILQEEGYDNQYLTKNRHPSLKQSVMGIIYIIIITRALW